VSGGSGSSSLSFYQLTENPTQRCFTVNFLGNGNGFNNPSYLQPLKDDTMLYAIQNVSPNGAVYSFGLNLATNPPQLTLQTQAVTSGTYPTHFKWDSTEQWLLVPNSGDGSISVIPINPDGTLGAQSTFTQDVGTGSVPLFTFFDPSNQFFFVLLNGLDQIGQFVFDVSGGFIFANSVPAFSLPANSDLRSAVWSSNGHTLYVLGGNSSQLFVLELNQTSGLLSGPTQTVQINPQSSFLPQQNSEWAGHGDEDRNPQPLCTNVATDIKLHPTGDWLLVSSSGSNTIGVFNISNGMPPNSTNYFPTRGTSPVSLDIDATGLIVIVVDQESNDIGAFFFQYYYEGVLFPLTPTNTQSESPNPQFVTIFKGAEDPNVVVGGKGL